MLHVAATDGVASITLDRADRGNALSTPLVEALLAELDRCCADPSLHTLLVLAAGRHFCTGFDLSDLDTSSDGDLLWRLVRIETLLARLWHAPLRTVAIARGRTWGAGADLFAACDLRLAHDDARFRFPGAGFGIVLGTRRLAERVGTERARAWVTGGADVDAAAALEAGLASAPAQTSPGDDRADDGTDRDAVASSWRRRFADGPSVDRDTVAAVHRATRPDRTDADLAALVRSASRPGLRDRIAAYRSRVRAART
jgi:enoyl-CoA hydratase